MDARRKTIVWVCALLIVAMGLYPPWVAGPYRLNQGYGWLFYPPTQISSVDLSRLAIEWIVVTVIGWRFLGRGHPSC